MGGGVGSEQLRTLKREEMRKWWRVKVEGRDLV